MMRMQKLDQLAQFIQSQVDATENHSVHELDMWRRDQWRLTVEEALRSVPNWN